MRTDDRITEDGRTIPDLLGNPNAVKKLKKILLNMAFFNKMLYLSNKNFKDLLYEYTIILFYAI